MTSKLIEVWKDISDYYGLYQVSNLGRVRGLDRRGKDGRKLKGKILKPLLSGPNLEYYFVILTDLKGKSKSKKVHRLVFHTFNSDYNLNHVVDHIDGDSKNNKLENLQSITQRKNIAKSSVANINKRESMPTGVYENRESGYFYSFKHINGKQYYLGGHYNKHVVSCFYELATERLMQQRGLWDRIKSIIALAYEEEY